MLESPGMPVRYVSGPQSRPEGAIVKPIRLTITGVLLIATVGACSSGGATDTNAGTDVDTTTTAGGESLDTSGLPRSEDSSAQVTIGDLTYSFDISGLPAQCNTAGPYFQGSFALDASGAAVQAGGPDVVVQLNFGIPPEDWESQGLSPGSVGVEDRTTGEYWVASADIGPADGTVGVQTINIDGDHATGTAAFIEINGFYAGDEPQIVEGTYDITCGTG
jgi:hypothetical protein